ncbi:hypothetical protein KMW28_26780 [Flammeovirga yaeyamensis]|uniref:GH18 domain-containing protein n=1 Tax=Flammeovirga yaeyamensis TaxID=367791 RepID=A0AAX1NDS2_9BACT|nr:glycosyl hydrolase family 18 protein [Flammeovirga yaeyamensis]MBB3701401.1 spore germination protein YaaH [Flammeovirga yaeyamensis]NMF38641.1 hypothetical protein [Flammeovirga yaeyamensis]QWG04505.1 hypothetical protein KMW28_26780 [Flammeovirga yaeyamensis]
MNKTYKLFAFMLFFVAALPTYGQEQKEEKKEDKKEEKGLRVMLQDYVKQANEEEKKEKDKPSDNLVEIAPEKENETEESSEDAEAIAEEETAVAEEENKIETDTASPPILMVEEKAFIDTLKMKNRLREVKRNSVKGDYTEEEWQKKMNLLSNKSLEGDYELLSDVEVFGWHPYWMGKGYDAYNFSLLSTIAYFSYELNPVDGKYHSIHDWETTALIDSAHLHNCKVLLTVTNFGYNNNRTFLQNRNEQQQTLITNLITLLFLRNADGVNIDFENIPKEHRQDFTNFIIDLSNTLRKANNNFKITLTIPPKDFNGVFDFKSLSPYVDQFIVMGYEFYGQNSNIAGPVAPIESGDFWWEFNVERSVLEYKVDGIPSDKLILGSPLYGAEWVTEDLTYPSKASHFVGYLTKKQIDNKIGGIPVQREPISGSAFHVYRDDLGRYHQIWFEDSTTLQSKVDLIKKHELKGIGFWALGFDNGNPEMWVTVKDNFTVTPDRGLSSFSAGKTRRYINYALRIMTNPRTLLNNPRMLLYMFGGVMGLNFCFIMMFLSFRYRLTKLMKVASSTLILVFMIIALGIFMVTYDFVSAKEVILMIVGILLGGLTLFFLSFRFFIKKELP